MKRRINMDEMIDKKLTDVGVKFTDRTAHEPVDAEFEEAEDAERVPEFLTNFLIRIKFPALFLLLTVFIGWAAHMDLMSAVIAVPGMCVCSACFGGSVK
jgi:hypothetical protein